MMVPVLTGHPRIHVQWRNQQSPQIAAAPAAKEPEAAAKQPLPSIYKAVALMPQLKIPSLRNNQHKL